MLISFARRPLNQDGNFTILGLLCFLGLIIPITVLVSNLSIITNASSQAHGMAYNIAFASVNRGVDIERTRTSGSVVMFRESLDGVNPDAGQQAGLSATYDDINAVSQKMAQAAGLSGDNDPAQLTLENAPALPMFTGYNDGSSTFGNRPVGLVSVGFDPIDAALYTRTFSGGGDCGGSADSSVSFPGAPATTTCWVDSRQAQAAARGGDRPAENAPIGSINPSAWSHYTSGAEVRVRVSRQLAFGQSWSDTKIGVAAFGRPCDKNKVSNVIGISAPGSHCQY
jgi:hypothetical protein